LLLAACLLAGPATAASFDCAKARTNVEKLVCASTELGALDERLAATFKAIGPEPEGDPGWGHWAPRVDDQRRWLSDVRNACRDAACLRAAYIARIGVLQHWHAPAKADAGVAGQYRVDKTIALLGGEEAEIVEAQDCLALVPRADGGFDLSIDSVQANAHSCSFRGRVRGTADVLQLVPGSSEDATPECRLRILVESGELRVVDDDGACREHMCGVRAHLDGLTFPRSGRRPRAAKACDLFDRD
jgi:uncharacterized protein YecT (DUF1311 family)